MVYWYESLFLYIVSFLVQTQAVDPSREACLNFENEYHQPKACECVTYQSNGLSTGHFHSPSFPKSYQREGGIHCILFNFIGDVNEIVQIKFLNMDLKDPVTVRPDKQECRDWLRIYKNLDRGDINENVRHQDEICGSLSDLKSKEFYSSGRALIMEFHTDPDSKEKHAGFKGVFTFLDKSIFKTDGTPQYGTQCSYEINSGNNHTKGKFFSPRYPQKYPKSADCQYMFMGHDNEHVKVLFRFIQLPNHSSRSRCDESGDIIRVYNGRDKSSKLLKTFCDNTHNQVELYSTGPYMYIEFHSDRHREGKGFAAEYEFLDKRWEKGSSPVPSDNGMPDNPTGVLKCNQTISSKGKKNGTITSPQNPLSYSSGIVCEYKFVAEAQERIQLRFTSMDLYYSAGDPDDPFECPSQDSITVYTYVDDKEEDLGQFCGKKHPQQLMSSGQKMKIVFKSEDTQKDNNSGFRIEYSFRTDFGVQSNGIQDKREECIFKFNSTRASEGTFTSPNYPGLYPHDMECEYIFNGTPDKEVVAIDFDKFDLHDDTLHRSGYFTSPNYGGKYPRNTECRYIFAGRLNEVVEIEFPEFDVDGIMPRCDHPTDSDYVAFSSFLHANDRKMKRYCGNQRSYQTQTSDAAFFRVIFRSNNKYDSTGFKAHYRFKKIGDPDRLPTPSSTIDRHPTEQPIKGNQRTANAGSRSQVSIAVSITTIILFCKSVIDHLLNIV